MSDQPITTHIPFEEPTIEQKKQWLIEWKVKVQAEMAGYNEERDKLFAVYKQQKEMYDGWLGSKMKRIKKYDNVLNGRKKVLIDIEKELGNLEKSTSVQDTQV
jgi:hypothetical protein